jgi:dTDP-4-dehydrorhamnose reductase
MNRILVIGANGQVGWELCRTLAPLGEVVPATRHGAALAVDLAEPDSIRRAVHEASPDAIVNAAAYTAVDKAETEAELAMRINGVAPGILAEEAKRRGIPFIHYSTDYVFDGTKGRPYTEEDTPSPLNAYGRSKLAGDEAIRAVGGRYVILRTSWVYGARGHNFLRTMLRLMVEREVLRVVDDQIGAPTWSRMIAEASAHGLLRLSRGDISGLYNLTCTGTTSWYGFAEAIARASAARPEHRLERLEPIPTSAYPTPAKRPGYSVLDAGRLREGCALGLPAWDAALALCLGELGLDSER